MDEDPLEIWIYFLTFIESLEIIFSQYKENCEVLLDYPKKGGKDITYYFEKAIRNLLHTSIDVHSRSLISEFPGGGLKCISKLWSHCANMTFSEKVDMIGFYNKLQIKEENKQLITSRDPKMQVFLIFSGKKIFLRSLDAYFLE